MSINFKFKYFDCELKKSIEKSKYIRKKQRAYNLISFFQNLIKSIKENGKRIFKIRKN